MTVFFYEYIIENDKKKFWLSKMFNSALGYQQNYNSLSDDSQDDDMEIIENSSTKSQQFNCPSNHNNNTDNSSWIQSAISFLQKKYNNGKIFTDIKRESKNLLYYFFIL